MRQDFMDNYIESEKSKAKQTKKMLKSKKFKDNTKGKKQCHIPELRLTGWYDPKKETASQFRDRKIKEHHDNFKKPSM